MINLKKRFKNYNYYCKKNSCLKHLYPMNSISILIFSEKNFLYNLQFQAPDLKIWHFPKEIFFTIQHLEKETITMTMYNFLIFRSTSFKTQIIFLLLSMMAMETKQFHIISNKIFFQKYSLTQVSWLIRSKLYKDVFDYLFLGLFEVESYVLSSPIFENSGSTVIILLVMK